MNKIALLKFANISEQVAAMKPEYIQAATNPWETAASAVPAGLGGAAGALGGLALGSRMGFKNPASIAATLGGALLGSGAVGYGQDYFTRGSEADDKLSRDLLDIQSDLESAAQFSGDPNTQFEMMQAADEINQYLGKK